MTFLYDFLVYLSGAHQSNEILQDILRWEKVNSMNEKNVAKYGDTSDGAIRDTLAELAGELEAVELELQRSPILLDDTDGIQVSIPPVHQ